MGKESIIGNFQKSVSKIDKGKLDKVLSNESTVMGKLKRLDPRVFITLFRQIRLSMQLLKDYKAKRYRQISWTSVAIIIAGVLYFLSPLDVIPDFLGVFGFTDDAIVLAFIFNSLKKEFDKYMDWRGLSPGEYA
ncbi:MAG: DUF1232 domain-containing protein [Bacteroidetes bacterium]|nr:DUF1232 domain-containing protein [Bacteroidota bacterium]